MKKFISSLLALGVFAVGIYGYDVYAQTAESETNVTFTADTAPTDPLDPTNPDLPGTETGTGNVGPLSIDYVPVLNFGTHAITGRIETYELEETKPYIQMTDKRGTGEGYTVKASLSKFTDTGAGTRTISDAKIDFKNSQAVTTSDNSSDAPTAQSAFTLQAEEAPITVLTAATDEGMGTWLDKWFATDTGGASNDNVELTINTGNAYSLAYSAYVTWSLEVTP